MSDANETPNAGRDPILVALGCVSYDLHKEEASLKQYAEWHQAHPSEPMANCIAMAQRRVADLEAAHSWLHQQFAQQEGA